MKSEDEKMLFEGEETLINIILNMKNKATMR